MKNSNFKVMNIVYQTAKYRHLLGLILVLPTVLFAQLKPAENLKVAAERPGSYLPLLYEGRVAVVANQTSMVNDVHLVDFLVDGYVNVVKVFSPEHGFRGEVSAGANVKNGKDSKTGLPIISLYGSNKKPTSEQLSDVDIIVFDIQDVGTRFYTYISTLSYVMEAAAENAKKVIVLDRPNPNGHFIDGPILEEKYKSFVGLHPIPIVHGLTVGEYAKMVNGEAWLKNGVKCDLEVIKCQNYDHSTEYILPIKPSPNLPNENAITLYPSLCLFEGTNVSVGRGTDKPFQQVGAPYFKAGSTSFTPKDRPGASNPPYEGVECKGFDLRQFAEFYLKATGEIYLYWLIEAYNMAPDKEKFFNNYFNVLAGNSKLQDQIKQGQSVADIKKTWQEDLIRYKLMRAKYLLYEDF